jgi:hypothetical protein
MGRLRGGPRRRELETVPRFSSIVISGGDEALKDRLSRYAHAGVG